MRTPHLLPTALLVVGLAAFAQQPTTPPPPQQPPSAGHDVGSGAGDIGKGAGGAAGNVAKGTGKGAADLVTLHPLNAAGNVGKGVGVGAKDAGVGAAKGTGQNRRRHRQGHRPHLPPRPQGQRRRHRQPTPSAVIGAAKRGGNRSLPFRSSRNNYRGCPPPA